MTLGLPPAGIFWQPSGGSPSPNSLPSPLRSFVPGSCSAHLGAVRVREARREGTGGPASAPSRPPRPPPALPLLCPSPAPTSRGGQHRGPQPRRLTPRPAGHCHRSLVGAAKPRNPSLPPCRAHAARIPRSAAATPAKHPRFLLWAFLPGTGDVCLVRKLEQMEKRPFFLPLLYPREEKPPRPFVFDSCPTLHYPGSSRGRKQPLRIQGAGHRRKSIRDKNQLLPE